MKMRFIKTLAFASIAAATSLSASAQTVDAWITNGDQSALLQKQTAVSFGNTNPGSTITITPATTYQTIDGFGFCLTEGSCEVINSLPAAQQDALLNEFFNPTTGMGNDIVRISIGASDLSSSSYSYDDNGPDASLNNFSLAGKDLTYLIPILKRILAINPNVKILATPWSAPKWMKDNDSWVGGSLQTQYYQTYANYFLKYLNAMKAQGINIWAITIQNEPENPYNEPSMVVTASQAVTFINNNLGPTIRNAGYTTKIIGYDHNLDDTAYPIQVANGSSYVDGSAFHLYAGNVSAMTTVKNATNKNVYFTEQYTSSTGGFSGDFSWHTQNVTIGSVNNWGRTSFEWNLASDQNYNPRTPGGCTTCRGAITVNNASGYTRNVSYYIIAQLSKFVKTGAVRIGSTCTDGSFSQAAFKNTDGTIALVVYNNSAGKNFTVGVGSTSFTTYVPGYSAVTLKWATSIPSTTGIITAYKDCNYAGNSGGLDVGNYTLSQLNALGLDDNDISSLNITEGYKVLLYDLDNFQGTPVEVTATTSCLTSISWDNKVSSLQVVTNGATNLAGTYVLLNRNSGQAMDVIGGLSATADGIGIQQWTRTNATNQQFTFTHIGNGTYEILNVNSQKSLDITSAGTADGVAVQQWTYYPTATNQQFIVVPTPDGFFKLVAKHSGKIVEVAGASTTAGAIVQQWTNNNQTCGQWRFAPLNETIGTGNGLRGNYFNGENFETPVFTRLDPIVDFIWGTGSPDATVNADAFSARWTGQVQAKSTATYTFYINSDNGRRLWVNNQLIIDKWINDYGTEYSGTIALTAGQKYDIKVEYFEDNGGAENHLSWSTFILPKEIIPQTQLYANTLPTVSITSPTNNQTFTTPATINITSTAADTDGNVAKVEFYNGDTKLGEDATSPFTYSWTNSTQGTYKITARATDDKGGITVSSITTVIVSPITTDISDLVAANHNISIYPNPVSSILNIDGNIQRVEIYHTTGAKLLESAQKNIDVSSLNAGLYIIKIYTAEQSVSKVFIKQ